MKILITGATGFIGRAAVLRLARDGHQLAALVRSRTRARAALGDGVELVAVGDTLALQRAVREADAVVNLAGVNVLGGRWTRRRRRALRDSRVGVTRAVVAAIARAPIAERPDVLVSASAIGYYGDRGDQIVDESSAQGRGFLAKLCADWEAAALRAESLGTRTVVLRIGVVLGREGGALARMLPLFRLGLGGRVGSGRQYVPWIHLDDLAEVIAIAVRDQRYRGVVNATAPDPVTNAELASALGRAVGHAARVPAPAVLVYLALGTAASAVLSSARVASRALHRLGFHHRFAHVDAALADLVGHEDGVHIARERRVPDVPYLEKRRPRHLLEQHSVLNAPIDEVFAFFTDAGNLALLTPPSLGFRIITPRPIAMREGAVIDYRVGLGPVPVRWRTVIERWVPEHLFADAQHRGPYRSWWHEHRFVARGDLTEVHDRVHYAAPFGAVGDLANRVVIAPMLRRIFAFRAAAIRRRFGDGAGVASRAA